MTRFFVSPFDPQYIEESHSSVSDTSLSHIRQHACARVSDIIEDIWMQSRTRILQSIKSDPEMSSLHTQLYGRNKNTCTDMIEKYARFDILFFERVYLPTYASYTQLIHDISPACTPEDHKLIRFLNQTDKYLRNGNQKECDTLFAHSYTKGALRTMREFTYALEKSGLVIYPEIVDCVRAMEQYYKYHYSRKDNEVIGSSMTRPRLQACIQAPNQHSQEIFFKAYIQKYGFSLEFLECFDSSPPFWNEFSDTFGYPDESTYLNICKSAYKYFLVHFSKSYHARYIPEYIRSLHEFHSYAGQFDMELLCERLLPLKQCEGFAADRTYEQYVRHESIIRDTIRAVSGGKSINLSGYRKLFAEISQIRTSLSRLNTRQYKSSAPLGAYVGLDEVAIDGLRKNIESLCESIMIQAYYTWITTGPPNMLALQRRYMLLGKTEVDNPNILLAQSVGSLFMEEFFGNNSIYNQDLSENILSAISNSTQELGLNSAFIATICGFAGEKEISDTAKTISPTGEHLESNVFPKKNES